MTDAAIGKCRNRWMLPMEDAAKSRCCNLQIGCRNWRNSNLLMPQTVDAAIGACRNWRIYITSGFKNRIEGKETRLIPRSLGGKSHTAKPRSESKMKEKEENSERLGE